MSMEYDIRKRSNYRQEGIQLRYETIKNSPLRNTAVECYAGWGTFTELYKKYFNIIVTNDINNESTAIYNLRDDKFIVEVLKNYPEKIDLVDFDAWGSPSKIIELFFSECSLRNIPFSLIMVDGLGRWMKLNSNIERIKERYHLDDEFEFNKRKPWFDHPRMIDYFIHYLSKINGLSCETITTRQYKRKNYSVGSWIIS